jgi:hypothetical protein
MSTRKEFTFEWKWVAGSFSTGNPDQLIGSFKTASHEIAVIITNQTRFWTVEVKAEDGSIDPRTPENITAYGLEDSRFETCASAVLYAMRCIRDHGEDVYRENYDHFANDSLRVAVARAEYL